VDSISRLCAGIRYLSIGFQGSNPRTPRMEGYSDSKEPLAKIATDLDFADQAHMTRSVKQLTGTAPQAWRHAANRFKTC
jgi:AraC-like DNA-binding protein